MDLVFQASQFTTESTYYTAKDKADFANQLVRFINHDFKRTLFTKKKLYERLSMSFGHIAHFNQDGFYRVFFTTLKGKVEFLRQTVAEARSDVERALSAWVSQQGLVEKYKRLHAEELERGERALFEGLKARYEPDLYPELRALVRGCHDYRGGNHGNDAALAAFHAGIDTVIRVVDAWIEAKRSGKNDTQINAVLAVGRAAITKGEDE